MRCYKDGKPVLVKLEQAFFNSSRSITIKHDVMIADGKGGDKPVVAMIKGESLLNEMVLANLALAKIGPWGGAAGGSLSFERMVNDKDVLAAMVKNGQVSQAALDHAKFLLSSYDWTLKNGFSPF